MNAWHGVGNLTRDPESGTTQSGINYCRFTVACQRKFKNAQGSYDADFISCVAWRQTAEFVQRHFIKGNKIGVSGSITTGSYTAQDGSKRYTTEITVDNVEFVVPRSDSGNGGGYGGGNEPTPPPEQNRSGSIPGIMQPPKNQQMNMNDFTEVDDDELPF